MTRLDRRLSWSVFALLLLSYAYFHQGGGWNENSRFDLVRAIVDDHTLAIDRYEANTGDKALFGGHHYSDKAPGLSFLAVPFYALVRLLRPAFGTEHDFVVMASYVVKWLTVSVAGATAGMLVYHAARKLSATPRGALIAALAYGLGTPAFPLSTMFFSHQLAALILVSAFVLALDEGAESASRTAAIALLCTSAALVEYPTLPAALGIGLFHVGPRLSRKTVTALAAAAIPALALVLYLATAFGSPLRVGYDVLSDPGARDEMHAHGLFGVTYPKVGVLMSLLIGRTRGLLPYSPALFLGVFGFVEACLVHREDEDGERIRRAAFVALGVVVYFVLFVGSYEWWQGGASFGSRHLAPMLPFLALPIAFVASRRPTLAVVLTGLSALSMLMVTAVHPKPSEWLTNPFWSFILPSFMKGQLALTKACPAFGNPANPAHHPFVRGAPYDAFNLGMLLGGHGLKSLVPLVAGWLTSAWALGRELGTEGPAASATSVPERPE